ncbi:MAG TPA: DNA polymerase/3'-5' exonuclease PolX, partial [Dehalococcoidia bacterium]|nr:DNA polymerase/3'-5' exonuclease PolX [Dehalococcoidia bacterium]
AIADGRLEGVAGIGDKLIQRWRRHFERQQETGGRIPLGIALPIALTVVDSLRDVPGVRNLTTAGSLRRLEETIGDIDIIGSADHPEVVTGTFVDLPQVREVLWHGPQKASVRWETGLQVDLRIVDHESFGALLHHFTGNRQHNIDLREYAVQRGWSISEYGLTNIKTGERVRIADEADLYARLGLAYIPPELRQGAGEIEVAARHQVPALVEESDLKGDLHAHTNWSDGADSIEAMARAAKALGRQYLAISDHSGGLGVANGLDRSRLLRQIEEVREVERRVGGIRLLTASEVDIRADGSLDLPNEVLAQLDWVVASVHSSFEQSQETATARVIRAIEHPAVTVIGHPSGRLIGRRDPIRLDYEAIFAACRRTGTAIEINSGPDRLDLRDHLVRRARDLGVPLVISTDAHSTGSLGWIRFGIGVARRGWCRPEDILNTRPVDEFLDWIRRKRAGRVA